MNTWIMLRNKCTQKVWVTARTLDNKLELFCNNLNTCLACHQTLDHFHVTWSRPRSTPWSRPQSPPWSRPQSHPWSRHRSPPWSRSQSPPRSHPQSQPRSLLPPPNQRVGNSKLARRLLLEKKMQASMMRLKNNTYTLESGKSNTDENKQRVSPFECWPGTPPNNNNIVWTDCTVHETIPDPPTLNACAEPQQIECNTIQNSVPVWKSQIQSKHHITNHCSHQSLPDNFTMPDGVTTPTVQCQEDLPIRTPFNCEICFCWLMWHGLFRQKQLGFLGHHFQFEQVKMFKGAVEIRIALEDWLQIAPRFDAGQLFCENVCRWWPILSVTYCLGMWKSDWLGECLHIVNVMLILERRTRCKCPRCQWRLSTDGDRVCVCVSIWWRSRWHFENLFVDCVFVGNSLNLKMLRKLNNPWRLSRTVTTLSILCVWCDISCCKWGCTNECSMHNPHLSANLENTKRWSWQWFSIWCCCVYWCFANSAVAGRIIVVQPKTGKMCYNKRRWCPNWHHALAGEMSKQCACVGSACLPYCCIVTVCSQPKLETTGSKCISEIDMSKPWSCPDLNHAPGGNNPESHSRKWSVGTSIGCWIANTSTLRKQPSKLSLWSPQVDHLYALTPFTIDRNLKTRHA